MPDNLFKMQNLPSACCMLATRDLCSEVGASQAVVLHLKDSLEYPSLSSVKSMQYAFLVQAALSVMTETMNCAGPCLASSFPSLKAEGVGDNADCQNALIFGELGNNRSGTCSCASPHPSCDEDLQKDKNQSSYWWSLPHSMLLNNRNEDSVASMQNTHLSPAC